MDRYLFAIANAVKHGNNERADFVQKRDIVIMDKGWRARLRAAIDECDLTQAEIARRAGVSGSFVTEIFSKNKEPGFDKVLALADAIGVSMAHLLYGVELDAEQEKLLRLFAQLNERQRQAIFDLVMRDES